MKKYFSSYWIRSAFYTFLQRFSLTFFGVINFMILARSLPDAEALGTWAIFLTITGIFEAAKVNLLKNAQIKYVSMSDDRHEKTIIASSSLLINIVFTLAFIVFLLFGASRLASWFNTGEEMTSMLHWFIPGLACMIFFSHLESVQQSHLDFKGGFAGHFVRQASFFILILSHKLSDTPLTLTDLAKYSSLTIGLGTLVLLVFTRKYLSFRFRPSRTWTKKIMGYGGYIFGSGVVASIFTNLDQIITAWVINPGAVAYYNVASRINLLVDTPSYAASEIIFPKASRALVEEGKEKVKYLFERMVAILIAITIPIATVIILFPKLITVTYAGSTYAAAAPILQLYMIAGIIRPAQNQAANLLNSIGKTRLVFLMNTGFMVVLLGMNFLFLKQFGLYGAAIGTMITSMLNFAAWYFLMRREINLDLSAVGKHMAKTYKSIFRKLSLLVSKTRRQTSYLP
ncbi:MAG TPA: flippase [Flavisolibacter sp.]|nr:flippase [Flavisolibacter sp.]